MLRKLALLGSALVLLIILQSTESTLTIGSFDIDHLNNQKASNAKIVSQIVKVLRGFDIAVILDVRTADAINVVLQALNKHDGPYSLKLSSLSGRSNHEEHVAILYRNDKLSAPQVRAFPDVNNKFECDPYAVLFHTTHSVVSSFVVVGVHLRPKKTLEEMNNLVKVYDDMAAALHTQNVLFAGDFKADCTHMTEAQFKNSSLVTDHRFTFLIDMNVDTTASDNTNCAYDRFVVAGRELTAAVVQGSARVINLSKALHLTTDEAEAVSDHYPIEMKIH
ncbi:deoxyribonuclease gamma-like [Pomacea canaliculata]|uniref:deoxyribonuclease gamma-like n=1 Tax=Pomacea canaliculata TaxID=400727 RepID=UPI000D72871D|nr:deoxyribonuclease gamma-like [Pomacea canaliculata]